MFDFSALQINSDDPSPTAIVFSFLLAFVLSSMLAFTYDKTTRKVAREDHFIQALILIALVAALVMQAIGDSLARGLGMLGALSIIRFRTTLRNPRNITFMFGSLGTGIACGVYGFVIAIIGTSLFCVVAFLLRVTPYSRKNNLIGNLLIQLPHDSPNHAKVEEVLKTYCVDFTIKQYRLFGGQRRGHLVSHRYEIKLRRDHQGWALLNDLKQIEDMDTVRLSFADAEINL